MKLLIAALNILCITLLGIKAGTGTNTSPNLEFTQPWGSGNSQTSSSVITDGVSHITRISFGIASTNGIENFVWIEVYGNGIALSKAPSNSKTCQICTTCAPLVQDLYLTSTQRIVYVKLMGRTDSSGNFRLTGLVFTLNDGTSHTFDALVSSICGSCIKWTNELII